MKYFVVFIAALLLSACDAIEKNPTQKSVFDKKLEPYEIEDYPEFTEELHQLCQSITRTNRFETTVGRIEVVDHNCFKAKMEMLNINERRKAEAKQKRKEREQAQQQ